MLQNFWKVAIRQLLRNKGFSLLNIVGLAMGMASALLIFCWIADEYSFDRWEPHQERLYELMTSHESDGKLNTWTPTPEIIPASIVQECPEVEAVARLGWNDKMLFNYKDKGIKFEGACADTPFIAMMGLPMLQGDPRTALSDPYSVVLTQDMAKRLFGDEDPMGKIVQVDSKLTWKVTGVLGPLPDNTQFKFEWLNSYNLKTINHWVDEDWTDVNNRCFVLLRDHASLSSANRRLRPMINQHSGNRARTTAFLYPLSQMRLYSEFENEKPSGGRIETVRAFGLIAILILLIACINFMNLSTARSERRSREVGVRKVAGALRRSLILQFLGESMVITVVSAILAVIIVELCMPGFGALTGKKLSMDFQRADIWVALIAFVIVTGLLAGSYPAFFLSSFKPAAVLKGQLAKVHALLTPRKVLVVVQFTIAVVLIIGSMVISRQIQYAQDRKPGYEQRNLIYIGAEGNVQGHVPALKAELLRSGGAAAVSVMSSPLVWTYSSGSGLSWEGMKPDTHVGFMRTATSGDFVKTTGLKLVEGRDIDIENYPTDSTACLINEAAVKAMGIEHPVGQWIFDDPVKWHIVGVIKDFILGSPYEPIKPYIVKGPRNFHNVIHIKLNPEQSTRRDLAAIEQVFKRYNPNYPFEYHFIDAEYATKFDGERLTARLAGIFAGLTILISCLGLFGLATCLAESRTKEIGIRKVLGASVASISLLLSQGFVRLVILSIVMAAPISWFVMHRWLEGYSYRITVSWWFFVLAGLAAVIIALVAVSSQAIRAARANPVRSLRRE